MRLTGWRDMVKISQETWSPPPFGLSPWIAKTCHQLLIRPIGSMLVYSTLGNVETHPAAPLLSRETSFARQWRQTPELRVLFLETVLLWTAGVGEVEFQKTHFPKLMCTSGKWRLCLLCLRVVILGWQTLSPSANIKHVFPRHSASLACFSHSTRKASDKRPRADGKILGRSNQSKEYQNSIPMVSQNIHTHTAYTQLCHLAWLHQWLHLRKNVGEIAPLRFHLWKEKC